MKLGVFSAAYKDKALVDSIDKISSFGFKAVEISAVRELHDPSLFSKEKLLEVKKKLETTGLTASVHGPIRTSSLCDFDEKIRKESVEKIKKIVSVMSELDSRILNVHPGYYQDKTKHEICFNNLIKSIKELLPLLEKTKINLCIENMAHEKSGLPPRLMRTPQGFKKLFSLIKSPCVNMTLDIAHVWIAKSQGWYEDTAQWSELIPRIKHIHLSGFDGTVDHVPVSLAKNIVDYDFVYDLMKDFDGIVILENRPEKVFLESLEFLKNKFPKIL